MGLPYKTAKSLYADTIKQVSRSPNDWTSFLDSALWMFEYSFGEQILIYAQRPNARACATIEDWNKKVHRWVNRGASGITLLRFEDGKMMFDNVFDVADTHQRYGKEFKLWSVNKNYTEELCEVLEVKYGDLITKTDLSLAIISAADNAVEDNIQDYYEDLLSNIEGSNLEKYQPEEIKNMFMTLVKQSVMYEVMKRCDEDPYKYLDLEGFSKIKEFNTVSTITCMGTAVEEISREMIREVRTFVRNKDTVDLVKNQEYLKVEDEKNERSEENVRILTERRLSDTEHNNGEIAESNREIRNSEGNILEESQERNIPDIVNDREISSTSNGNTENSRRTSTADDRGNEEEREYNGGTKSDESDEMGWIDEQLEDDSRGNSDEGANLQLRRYFDRKNYKSEIAFLHNDEIIKGILKESPHLKKKNSEIIAYFREHLDNDERAKYLQDIYNDEYTEIILKDSGERVGYKTYQNVLCLWTGSYLSRTSEAYYSWDIIAKYFDSLIVLGELETNIKPLPSVNGQLSFIDNLVANTHTNDFSFSQEIIDIAILGGSNFEHGKFRIYDFFLQSLSTEDNINFLKAEYGIGGCSSIQAGLGIGENHSAKGIELYRGYKENAPKKLLTWNYISNRINELIKLDRYLTPTQKEEYNKYKSNNTIEVEEVIDEEVKYDVGDSFIIDNGEFKIESVGKFDISLNDKQFPLINRVINKEVFEEGIKNKTVRQIIEVKEQNKIVEEEEKTVIDITPAFSDNSRSSKLQSFNLHPEVEESEKNQFVITDDNLGVGTPKEKYKNNIEAIKTLKKCESENRYATKEEQEILSKYVGWGGLSQAFDERNESWSNEYKELKELLTEKEYLNARESTLTAFYTPPIVIKSIYQVLSNIGFKSGNILEPACGIGNFFGMLPTNLEDCKLYGVELDSITGRIAQQLYQKSTIAIEGYEKTYIPDSFFDVAVGNVPFGDFKVLDKRYDKNNFLIHDYFFAKTLDKVRPGGVIAFVTSKGTMDKENSSVRRYIAQRADLLGAIRLPNNTFKNNAGTEVTSDIIFLQKRENILDIEPEWVHLGVDENGIKINQYFIDNPQMILGKMTMVSGQFGMTAICKPDENMNLSDSLKSAIPYINAEMKSYELEELDEKDTSIPANLSVRNFSYTIVNDKVYYRNNSRMYLQDVPVTSKSRIKELIKMRECLRTLIELQTDDEEESKILDEQKKLNILYDDFVKKYGRIFERGNNNAFSEDSSYYLLCSLEVLDEKGKFVRKADMFYKRTIKAHRETLSVGTSSEALVVSISEKAKVDLDFMSKLTNKTKEEIVADLKGVIFKIPYSNDVYVTASEYLSGNVREKLKIAESAVEEDDSFSINVEELKKSLPKDLTASEITVKLGSTWIPIHYIEEFMYELLGTSNNKKEDIKIYYSDVSSSWNISHKSYDSGNIKVHSTYGTNRINAYKIIEDTLNLRSVKIFDYVLDENGNKQRVLNKKETAIAQSKQDQIKQAFEEWIWKAPERREDLTKLYNERFNAIKPREYDGSHIKFGGINPEITLRKHQENAIAHILYGGNTLLAHEVGAGKTFEMVAAAMESKRLGLCNKSIFVVPNHIIGQFAGEFLQLYPSANILVATKKDFSTNYRKRFCSKIATGDYDAIIIGHSQFERIPMSEERQRMLITQQLADIERGIMELKENDGENYSIKDLERSRKKLETKLEKLNDQTKKDNVIIFEQLGIDRMFVDEAHNYKNLFLYTKMKNVGGIAQTEAQKSSDLFMKCRYLDELTGNKGVIFATGTPISNSMVELYTMQRYLQYDTLAENGLQHFDSWASTFGETVTAVELSPEGTGYRAKTRFAKFHNLPELMSMFKEVADIQTSDTLNLPVPEAEFHNVVVKPSEFQKNMVADLGRRAESIRTGNVDPTIDNMLRITNDGRKLALDQRLIDEMLPDFDGSKINACADNIFDIWKKYEQEKMAQLVFCDLSTPKELAKAEEIFDNIENDSEYIPPFIDTYTDLKCKLIKRGIPRTEIAFIHEADNETKKKELFAKVRNGTVRVLIGSTFKMGAGTNVQTKLIALHDMDCPWRPADLTQRLGRIVRQGNSNKLVHIYRYVTEGTFDAYLYQLVENKQKFISQIMTSKAPVRSANDVDETALSYAEIKALAAGNPLIIEKTQLDSEVAKLNLLKQSFLNQKYHLEDRIIKYYPVEIARVEKSIEDYMNDIAVYEESKNKYGDEFPTMIIKDVTYKEKEEAGQALLNCFAEMTTPAPTKIGEFRGFDLELMYNSSYKTFDMNIKKNETYSIELGKDVYGNITRIENAFQNIYKIIEPQKLKLEELNKQFINAQEETKKEFPYENELKEKIARLLEVNMSLEIKDKEDEIIDDFEDVEEVENNKKDKDKNRER